MGADAEIRDIPGYLPLMNNPALCDIYAANAEEYFGEIKLERGLPFCGSTDMGDLSYLIPVIQPTVSGFSGAAHSKDFRVSDDNLAYVLPAKLMAAAVIDLLRSGAEKAKDIKERYPRRSKEQYEELWENILN